ncbi:LacI family DNA-binding transcriptional regulator [Pseudactinotalea suaedae]|uniref:LacI family DNA-binding transcriptional regulator n=1 Tax=Pseudactinotalea suaedae TaxID=1524924 RepID=UPI001F4FDDA3|nr:LacI family DNA-binding transcriptional regulator [Pseudactinotalea suaedae]
MTTAGSARPTMHDVARLAGVSQKTVSNVLNDYAYVRSSTRERVMAAVEELGYRMNTSARTLRTGRHGVIGCALPYLQAEYFAELADAVIDAAKKHGWRVLIEQTGGLRERELEVLTGFRSGLDGLIMAPTTLAEPDAALLADEFPVVLLNENSLGDAVDSVAMAHYEGSYAATQHLIAGGRTAIAAIGAHPQELEGSAVARLQGYSAALLDAGLELDRRRIAPTTLWHRREGADAAAQLLTLADGVDAIFCFNDALALGAMRTVLASGRRIPDDVALIGFDDIEAASYATPSLSSVAPGSKGMADAAVTMLADRLAGRVPARATSAGYRLVVRESTGW